MTFTLDNTKDATHVDIIRGAFEFLNQDTKKYLSRTKGKWVHDSTGVVEIGELIELSRSTKETKEYHTDHNGVTQYAQGNKMNTDNLIPIDFSRKITPSVDGDLIWDDKKKVEFTVSGYDSLSIREASSSELTHLYVISFADRPNTGKQPVGDDVVIDFICDNGEGQHLVASKIEWKLGDSHGFSPKSWKPNHAAMLKQWQAEQSKEWPSCDSQENIGPGVALAGGDSFKESLDKVIKPTFTQAMADAGELPAVGSDIIVIFREVKSLGTVKYISGLGFLLFKNGEEYYYEHESCDIKPIDIPEVKATAVNLELPDPSVDESSDGSRIGNIGNILHNMSCSMTDDNEQSEFGGYASFCWELGVKLNERTNGAAAGRSDKPIFTQAQCDAGELPHEGVLVQMKRDYALDQEFYNVKVNHVIGGKVWITCDKYGDEILNWGRVTFRPVTEADILRDAITEFMVRNFNGGIKCLAKNILASDKFTITLNEG